MGKERGSAGGSGFDESIGNRENKKVFIFSDMPREKGMRERACGADSSLDRGGT